jgi:hypothetical protein
LKLKGKKLSILQNFYIKTKGKRKKKKRRN